LPREYKGAKEHLFLRRKCGIVSSKNSRRRDSSGDVVSHSASVQVAPNNDATEMPFMTFHFSRVVRAVSTPPRSASLMSVGLLTNFLDKTLVGFIHCLRRGIFTEEALAHSSQQR
jgi:hypothetical protein